MVLKKCEIAINDVLEELNEENRRLLYELLLAEKCLKLFAEFKTLVELNFHQYKDNLQLDVKQNYEQLVVKLDQIADKDKRHLLDFTDENHSEDNWVDNCLNYFEEETH